VLSSNRDSYPYFNRANKEEKLIVDILQYPSTIRFKQLIFKNQLQAPCIVVKTSKQNKNMELIKINPELANVIIETRDLRGFRFYYIEKIKKTKIYTGIDNSRGEAWTESFPTLKLCKDWLNDKFEMSDYSEEKKQYKTHEPRITFDYY
jgi:hypothetical protein